MTDEQDGQPHRPPIDGPTVMGPSTGHLHGPAPEEPTLPATPPDEPTLADPAPPPSRPDGQATTPADDATLAEPAPRDEATIADPRPWPSAQDGATPVAAAAPTPPPSTWSSDPPAAPRDEPGPTVPWPDQPPPADLTVADATVAEVTVAEPAPVANRSDASADDVTLAVSRPVWPDDQSVATPVDETTLPEAAPDGPTMAVVDESPTTTGPTVASWPLDELLPPPPTDLVWRPDTPEPPPPARRPAYYIALGAAVVLVVALIAAAALATVVRPTREVAGTAKPTQAIPDITGSAPPTSAPTEQPQESPADHPLSTSTARMADATCALPRFDLADDRQAAFYAAAKTCADSAWRGVLDEAGLRATIEVVTVTGPVQTRSCGEITPDRPSTQCDGTVYMTPAHLRDTEQNGRYPGRYFGVLLREYARALQFATGLSELAATTDDAEAKLAQQATCMAGIASGAMANRGAVDANITGEISDRLTSVDAPPDAKAMLDKGFQERTLKSCDTW
ncbi:hypothetical protein [Actinophytocola algeriensis]|uniref:Metalloprotease n=1 Tax=Actinophytocola algeriensis TaxID=1768010 RepID=A0A7W7Q8Q3_9PSEU|nr:hypothetical protein [Actinophytocola algeriensis]MBB4909096.1 hypothetical protein [Actinophytocola algeriensis]MBE1474516.1 hypothetical protein [Actinophytocola algeriensis]